MVLPHIIPIISNPKPSLGVGSPLAPGVEVVVSGVEKDRFFRASIKWCKRVGPIDKRIYGIGAKYYEKAYQK